MYGAAEGGSTTSALLRNTAGVSRVITMPASKPTVAAAMITRALAVTTVLTAGRACARAVVGRCFDQPGGKIGGERGQFRNGPRSERLPHPQVKLVFGQPSLDECGLEHLDQVLAVEVGHPHTATAVPARWHPVSRPRHRRRLPLRTEQPKPTAVVLLAGHLRSHGHGSPQPSDP